MGNRGWGIIIVSVLIGLFAIYHVTQIRKEKIFMGSL